MTLSLLKESYSYVNFYTESSVRSVIYYSCALPSSKCTPFLPYVVQPCKEGSLRLAGGLPGSNNTGRVEMCIQSVWAGLCDTSFDKSSAQFVCSQLDLPAQGVCVVCCVCVIVLCNCFVERINGKNM